MRLIIKGNAPEILEKRLAEAKEKNLDSNAAYGLLNHEEKQIVLQNLMKEQGHLCAYCMRKIPDERPMPDGINRVTIEHWFPRNPIDGNDVGQGLDYNNLFAVCSGNRGRRNTRRQSDLTCDAKRKSSYSQLTLNPCDGSTLSKIKYKENGEMYSDDKDIQDDITVKLNLNCISDAVQLPESRRKVLEVLQDEIKNSPDIVSLCNEFLSAFENEIDPRTEYSGILIWWLREFISEKN